MCTIGATAGAAAKEDFKSDSVSVISTETQGKCLVSGGNFEIGDTILIESPMIVMPSDIFDSSDEDLVETWLDKQINELTCQQRQLFFDLSDSRTSKEAKTSLGIFYTNDMNYIQDSAALFPLMARANHSCSPNADFVTRPDLNSQTLIAIKKIGKGEPVTVSYLPSSGEGSDIKSVRQKYLSFWYLFTCQCSLCLLDDEETLINDLQRLDVKSDQLVRPRKIDKLETFLDNINQIGSKYLYQLEELHDLLTSALESDNLKFAARIIVEGLTKASIINDPSLIQYWEKLRNSQLISICGKLYIFP